MASKEGSLETKVIHAGELKPRIEGSVSLPIFQSAMFEYKGGSDYNDLRYLRLNNSPNHEALHQKMAALEGAEAGLVTASGMAAITTSLLAFLQTGDHMLAQNTLYGGTHDFMTGDLPALGVGVDFISNHDPESWEAMVKPNTKVIYVEAMTNPTLDLIDHGAVIAFAKKHGLVSMIDSTFATPVNFQASAFGYDVTLHSATKYLNGHSDIVAGALTGSQETVTRVLHKLNHLGGSLDPHAGFLLHRGIKTLALRVKHQNQTALTIAEFLEGHPAVGRVNYLGLKTNPKFALATSLFSGFGGVLSFELKAGDSAVGPFIERLELPIHTFSLGGVESLIIQPARTSHLGMSPQARAAAGISDGLLRFSVGVESAQDLIEDLTQALDRV